MKELISIYVSLFLVFSPLYGQTKQEATIYLTSGYVGKVTVIKIGEMTIEVEMKSSDGQLLKQYLKKSMIYQILLPGGEALYRNPDAKDIFDNAVERIRRNKKIKSEQKELAIKQREQELAQLITQKEYEKREKWNIILTGEDSFLNVALWGLRGDSLVVIDTENTKTIYIGSIANISAIKEKNKAGEWAKKGFNGGAVAGGLLALLVLIDCNSSKDYNCGSESIGFLDYFKIVALSAIIVGLWFGSLYSVKGSFLKYVEEYDMSNWSIEEKRVQIQNLMK